jgi:hypothetical protein
MTRESRRKVDSSERDAVFEHSSYSIDNVRPFVELSLGGVINRLNDGFNRPPLADFKQRKIFIWSRTCNFNLRVYQH